MRPIRIHGFKTGLSKKVTDKINDFIIFSGTGFLQIKIFGINNYENAVTRWTLLRLKMCECKLDLKVFVSKFS